VAERAAVGVGALELRLGGYAATAEAAWMGVPLATEALEPARLPRLRLPRPALPRVRLRGLLNREFGIAGATVLLMASFFFSAGLGAVRQVVFNAIFGAGSEASAYYAAFRLPDTLFSLIAGGALSTALIPVLLGTVREDGEEAGWRLASLVLNALLAVVLVVTIIGEIFAPVFVDRLLVPGFDAETKSLTVTLTRVMLLQPAILVVGTVATALLNSRNQFVLTALSVASHNVALICGIVVAATWPRVGIYGPTFGVIGGAVLQTLILLPGLVGAGARYVPRWNLRDQRLREVGRLLLPNGLAVGVGYAGFIVDTAFASRAGDRASLAAIQNAWLLVGLPIALLGQAVGQAAFPRLAAHAGGGDMRQFRRTLVRALAVMCGLAVLGVAGMVVLGRPVIKVLFEHGDFTSGNGDLTSRVLMVYALGLPAYVATEVLVRALLAMRDARTQLYTNSAQLLLRIVLVAVLLDRFQARAIPFAFALSATLETCALLVITFGRISRLQRSNMRSAAATADRPPVVQAEEGMA
jgi:putative peptidoglycan lipid II flippase